MADNFIDAVKGMQRKMNQIPQPQELNTKIMDAQKALLEALRTDPKLGKGKMTGNGK